MKVAKEAKKSKGLLKIVLICCAAVCVVVASVVSIVVLSKPNGTKEIEYGYEENNIYYATPDEVEAYGAASAANETKGEIRVEKDDTYVLSEGMVLEGGNRTYGGAVYVEAGGTFVLEGGIIQFNSAEYGGAIYAEAGATVILNSGKIICNTGVAAGTVIFNAGAEITQEDAVIIEYNYNTPRTDYILYYVDGEYFISIPLDLVNDTFVIEEYAPLDYSKCCGYFSDPGLNNAIEAGDVVSTGLNVETVYGKNLYKAYTRTATDAEYLEFDEGVVSQKDSNNPSGVLVIPREHEGTAITTIKQDGFKSNNGITAVYLPSTIKTIKQYAFRYCSNLSYITLPYGIETIERNAFEEANLTQTSLVIPNSVETIGKKAFYNAFDSSVQEMNLTLSSSLTVIESDVFGYCRLTSISFNGAPITKIKNGSFHHNRLTSLSLPETLVSIYDHAFDYNNLSSSFRLPSSVQDVGTGAFDYQGSTTEINANGVYLMQKGGYYLGKVDTSADLLLKPYDETNYNPYYFLVNVYGDTIDLNAYTKFMSRETVYLMDGCTITQTFYNDNFIDLDKECYGNAGNDNTYVITYNIYSKSGGEAKLKIASVSGHVDNVDHDVKYVYVPKYCTSYIYGCCNGISLHGICVPSFFGKLGSLFKVGSGSTNNSEVPSSFKSIIITRSIDDDSAVVDGDICKNCATIEYAKIDSGITTIGNGAFSYCTNLKQFEYDTSEAISIGNDCFRDCTSLRYIVIGAGASVGTTFLRNCTELRFVFISKDVDDDLGLDGSSNGICTQSINVTFYTDASEKPADWNADWNDCSHSSTRGTTGNLYATCNYNSSVEAFMEAVDAYYNA